MDNVKWPHLGFVVYDRNSSDRSIALIKSILEQNYPKDKIHVCYVDNASDNDTYKYVSNYMYSNGFHNKTVEADVTIKDGQSKSGVHCVAVRANQKVGPSICKNLGIGVLKDKLEAVIICEPDTILKESTGSRLVLEWLQSPNQIGISYSDYEVNNITTNIRTINYLPPFNLKYVIRELDRINVFLLSIQAVDTVGLFDNTLCFGENYDLFLKVSSKFMVSQVAETLYEYNIYGESAVKPIDYQTLSMLKCAYTVVSDDK